MRTKIKKWQLLLLLIPAVSMLFLSLPQLSFGQQGNNPKQESIENDPIVDMLDSLVSQHFLLKSNVNSRISTQTENTAALKTFSDEVYAHRISALKSPIPFTYNEAVKNYIDLYAVRKRNLTARVMGLSEMYFPMFEEILDQQNLPLEFKYLAIVESALNPTAVSKAGATGIWQFMFNTAKMYSLNINSFVDERKDPYLATYAACEYFKDMYAIYKDWLLVIAAYNCGPGNVNKAIARSGGKTNFWEIARYLPAETRGYVPAFIAVNYVMSYADEHNIQAVPAAISYFETDTIKINKPLSFEFLSSQLDIPLPVIEYLNPSFRKNIIPASHETYMLRLPYNKTSLFAANSDAIFQKFAEETDANELKPKSILESEAQYITQEVKRFHKVRRGERMIALARKYNCSVSEIKQWNKLRGNVIKPGQKLVVFVSVKKKINPPSLSPAPLQTETEALAKIKNPGISVDSTHISTETATIAQTPAEPETHKINTKKITYVYHVVQKGDTLWRIANKYKYEGVTVEILKQLNKINNSKDLKPGTKLKVVAST